MKSVILINYTGRKGGGPLDAFEMTKALVDEGLSVAAVLSDQIENLSMWKDLRLEKLVTIPTYHNIFDAAISTAFFFLKQKKYIECELKDYDVKYIYCPMGALWSSKINKIFPKAKKGIVIHDPQPHSGDELRSRLFKSDYSEYDYLFVHSKAFVDYVKDKYKKPTAYLLLGSHKTYKYCNPKSSIITYDSHKINFLFFGRIEKYKGLDILGEAYNNVYKRLGDAITLNVIGSGDFSPYNAQYSKLKNVTIINRWIKDEEIESAFKGDNIICICPYIDATQSGVALISMDYGVPVIATDTGGMGEQVKDGITGILVPPADTTALAEAMQQLANNIELRNQITKAQKKYIASMGWDVSAKQLIQAMNIQLK